MYIKTIMKEGKKMSKSKKIIACLLALSLLFVITAACADSTNDTGITTDPGTTSTGGAAGGGAIADGPFSPYPETLVITVPIAEWGAQFFIEGENHSDNLVTRHYEEVLNIRWEPMWIVDGSQGEERMNTAIAANDLPDMFTAEPSLIGRLIQANQIQELGSHFDNFASDRLREIATFQDGRGFLMSTHNGLRYGIPEANDFANNVAMTWIRQDWLDEHGLE